MREFDKPIGKVWRRMRLQRFLSALVWALGGFLLVAVGVAAAVRFVPLSLAAPGWAPFAAAGALAVAVAALIAAFTGPSRVDAAVAIDHRFHLNERVSTALTLPAELRETPAGRALMADAIRHVEGLDLAARFGLKLPRTAWVPLIPAVLAGILLVLPEGVLERAVAGNTRTAPKVDQKQLEKQVKSLTKAIDKTRKQLDKDKFAEADKLLAEIEKAAKELSKAAPNEKEKALIKLNELTNAVKDRQKQIGSSEQVAKQLQKLKEMSSDGPADDFAKDLARGDFEQAAEELQKLREKLAAGKMTEAEKKKLKEQLGEMKEQLEKLANLDQRKKQLEEALKSGQLSKEQFEQQMAKLNDQARDLQKMQQMAQQLAQAQQAMDKGDMQQAADALGMSQEQLEQMAQQVSELETLDAALADLQDAKDAMNGDGMNQIGERLDGMAQLGGNGFGDQPNGFGMGRGRGRGDRPEAPDDTSAYNTKVKQQYGKGKAVLEGFGPPGATVKGESLVEVMGSVEAAAGSEAEAITNQKIPNNVKKHVLNYFDQIRKGE